MTEQLKQITKDELVKLPEEKQKVINSFDWATITEKVGLKYFLDETQINKLQTEVLLVLINAEYLDDLKLNIQKNLDTSELEAMNMSDELIKQIFVPIANNLNEVVKSDLRLKNPKWDQSVNFIVSGGDYSVFLDN